MRSNNKIIFSIIIVFGLTIFNFILWVYVRPVDMREVKLVLESNETLRRDFKMTLTSYEDLKVRHEKLQHYADPRRVRIVTKAINYEIWQRELEIRRTGSRRDPDPDAVSLLDQELGKITEVIKEE